MGRKVQHLPESCLQAAAVHRNIRGNINKTEISANAVTIINSSTADDSHSVD